MFKFKPGINVEYVRQGYVYFVSRRYGELDKRRQQAIDAQCQKCGGEHWRALREFVTTDKSATKVSLEHYISESTLRRAVRSYYETFPRWL